MQAWQDKQNFSLYTFDQDTSGTSTCALINCLANWPPYLAAEGEVAEAPFSIIPRPLNDMGLQVNQWAIDGKPLYFYHADLSAEDVLGENITDWQLARPKPIRIDTTAVGSALVANNEVITAIYDNATETTQTRFMDGVAIYTWSMDTAGQASTCIDVCLTWWPALLAHPNALALPPYSLIPRANTGHLQWALNGMPLYLSSIDSQPGDANGDGVEDTGVWQVARNVPVLSLIHI